MCKLLLVLLVIFLQGNTECNVIRNRLSKRSPQQIDIQSIRQKQLTPEITVVDVVVNEPARRGYPTRNQYIQPSVSPQRGYPGQNNYYPNSQYVTIPNRREPEIKIIEVVDPRQTPGNNFQQWQRYPQRGQIYPNNERFPYQDNNNNSPPRGPPTRPYMNNGNRPNRRPYRPNSDFYISEMNENEDFPPGPPPHRGGPGHRGPGHRGPGNGNRGPKPKPQDENDSSEEEQYVFDAGDSSTVVGYTKDNFPIIPLRKNDIRR